MPKLTPFGTPLLPDVTAIASSAARKFRGMGFWHAAAILRDPWAMIMRSPELLRPIGWAVAWNVSSPFRLVRQPPGTELVHRLHWHTGHNRQYTQCHFRLTHPGKMVGPASLYL